MLRIIFILPVLLIYLTGCGDKDKNAEKPPPNPRLERPTSAALDVFNQDLNKADDATVTEFTSNPDDLRKDDKPIRPSTPSDLHDDKPPIDLGLTDEDTTVSEVKEPPKTPGFEKLEDETGAKDEKAKPTSPVNTPIYAINFQRTGSAKSYLSSLGFEKPSFFVSDIDPVFKNNSLEVGDKDDGYFGLRTARLTQPSAQDLKKIKVMKVNWATHIYPPGENWNDKNKRRQSVGLVVSFGPKTSAGVPYFLGFILSKTGPKGKYFKPSRYGEVGRYTTVASPPPGQFITSEIDLRAHFAKAFPGVPYPGVSALGIEVDTRGMEGYGAIKAVAFY